MSLLTCEGMGKKNDLQNFSRTKASVVSPKYKKGGLLFNLSETRMGIIGHY